MYPFVPLRTKMSLKYFVNKTCINDKQEEHIKNEKKNYY